MPEMQLYEYAIIRILPCAERGEFVNVGLAMMCKRRKWLRVAISINRSRLSEIARGIDTTAMENQLRSFELVASGSAQGGPLAELTVEERFRWLTAMRSASLRTSRPHPGLTTDLDSTFTQLMERLVL